MNKFLHAHIHSNIILRSQKVGGTQVSTTREWINKTYNGVVFSLTEDSLTHALTRMDPEGIMLGQVNQLRQDKFCMSSLI